MNPRVKAWLRQGLPKTVSPKRIRGGPLRGAWIVTSWHDYPAAILGRTEGPLLAWFGKCVKAGETWLDVGAHYGYSAIALSRLVGGSGRVFAFEPVSATAGCVAQSRDLNRLEQLTVLPLGLGAPDALGLVRLPVARGMADSTLAPGAASWFTHIAVAKFDWLWPRINGGVGRVHGMKIDVQGMELDVLRGMHETLRAERPLLAVEFHARVDRQAVISFLDDIGYSPRAIPIEPLPGETDPQFHDNHSYAFYPV